MHYREPVVIPEYIDGTSKYSVGAARVCTIIVLALGICRKKRIAMSANRTHMILCHWFVSFL
jgi:hypothetical protein